MFQSAVSMVVDGPSEDRSSHQTGHQIKLVITSNRSSHQTGHHIKRVIKSNGSSHQTGHHIKRVSHQTGHHIKQVITSNKSSHQTGHQFIAYELQLVGEHIMNFCMFISSRINFCLNQSGHHIK